MKKAVSSVIAALMCLCILSSCADDSQEEKNASTIIANYSILNEDGGRDFIVEVQDLGGVYSELYDKNGLYIKFKGGSDKIYDADGKEISRDDLTVGATLEISYDGKIIKDKPKTIKAYKVTVIG